MYWQDSDSPPETPTADILDVRYRIRCDALPVDHARELRTALMERCAWLGEEPRAGIHTIHGAESGNGWVRPDDPDTRLPLSRRTRLILRLPQSRLAEAQQLCGQQLTVSGGALAIEHLQTYPLQAQTTVFARYVAGPDEETAFLRQCQEQLHALGLNIPRMLAGRNHPVRSDQGLLQCRSLMLDGLTPSESLTLQMQGLGPHRLLGCGLFLPHKSIAAVRPQLDPSDPEGST